jgi:hypothetical protein
MNGELVIASRLSRSELMPKTLQPLPNPKRWAGTAK